MPKNPKRKVSEFEIKMKGLNGGLSGLWYMGSESAGQKLNFLSVTDRGPNGAAVFSKELGYTTRQFIEPNYVPRLVFFQLDLMQSVVRVQKQIELKNINGMPMSGLPSDRLDANLDKEIAVDNNGRPFASELLGIDPESVAQDADGNIWIGEEYRPSIIKFSASGKLLKMYTPEKYYDANDLQLIEKKFGSSDFIHQILPSELKFRKLNRGFEGLAIKDNFVFAILQSPLRGSKFNKLDVPLLRFEISNESISQFSYPLSDEKIDKIGDISFHDGQLFVLEQDSTTGASSHHDIFSLSEALLTSRSPQLESSLNKLHYLNLVELGIDRFEKLEGMAFLPDGRIAIINDNDFGIPSGVEGKTILTLVSAK